MYSEGLSGQGVDPDTRFCRGRAYPLRPGHAGRTMNVPTAKAIRRGCPATRSRASRRSSRSPIALTRCTRTAPIVRG